MSWIDAARQRLRDLVAGERADRDLDEEIAHHIDLETARQIRDGLDPAAARAMAYVRFGNPTLVGDATRAERGPHLMEGSVQDLSWALRSLHKNAGFTALALVTLVLGIGACTVAFSVFNTVLLRPLPYRDADRLVFIRERNAKGDFRAPSFPNFASWREDTRSFSGVAAAMYPYARTVAASGDAEPERVPALEVTHGFFSTLGVAPALGREFTDAEHASGRPRVVMVSYEFWQNRMAARQPLGTIQLGDAATPVVGVLPRGFRFFQPADVYLPHEGNPGTVRSSHNYQVIARLKPGATLSSARAEMSAISRSLYATYGTETEATDAEVRPLREFVVANYRTLLSIIFAAAGLVLLIACTNLVSAQLARGWHREREVVVRAALGASRSRIARQLLLESTLLVALGAAVALLAAFGAINAIRIIGGNLVPRLSELSLDARVVEFAIGIALLTAIVVGVYPALRLARRDAGQVLRAGRGGTSVRSSVWRALVGFEVALAVMLVIGSALLVRTLRNILSAETGFDSHGIVTAAITPQESDATRFSAVVDGLRAIPGVEGVAFASNLPLQWGAWSGPVRRPSDPKDRDWPAMAGFRVVSPEYFSVLRQPVVRGRAFTVSDRPGAPGVAIITTGIAEKLWPGQDPIGKSIATNYLFNDWLTVVGVVAEASNWSMPHGTQNEIYVPLAQREGSVGQQIIALLRTNGPPGAVMTATRTRLREILPHSPAQIGTIDERIAKSAADRRFAMLALTAFGVIAIVLAAVGIYGVMWYIVSTRTHEIGIRMALGATTARVRRDVLSNAAAMAAIGVLLGLAGGAFAARYLRTSLYGVSQLDPSAYLFGAAATLTVAVLAAYVPAWRSSRVDPMEAIRDT
ncbi:MAG TPA: ABC transporter permease [Gemmatimonadaceae bacterium]